MYRASAMIGLAAVACMMGTHKIEAASDRLVNQFARENEDFRNVDLQRPPQPPPEKHHRDGGQPGWGRGEAGPDRGAGVPRHWWWRSKHRRDVEQEPAYGPEYRHGWWRSKHRRDVEQEPAYDPEYRHGWWRSRYRR
jgi:hypothetical protein